jgi:hypothetical protein
VPARSAAAAAGSTGSTTSPLTRTVGHTSRASATRWRACPGLIRNNCPSNTAVEVTPREAAIPRESNCAVTANVTAYNRRDNVSTSRTAASSSSSFANSHATSARSSTNPSTARQPPNSCLLVLVF